MAALQDDFAAYTTIGERVAVPAEERKPVHSRPTAGPSFATPVQLEPFILLSKSARGAAAAGLIEKATAAPGVYVFSELLQQPSIKDLASSEQHAKSYALLELFAYGTWADYTDKRDQYPKLSREHETKLKHLTVLSLAAESRIIPYATLLSTLSLEPTAVPELEDLLIELFYANVLTGRLDQKHSRLEVVTSHGRDVRATSHAAAAAADSDSNAMQVDNNGNGNSATAAASRPTASRRAAPSISSLQATLLSWQTTLSNLIRSLEDNLGTIHAQSINDAQLKYQHEERVKGVVEVVAAGGGGNVKNEKGTTGGGAARNKLLQQAGAVTSAAGGGGKTGAAMDETGTGKMDLDESDQGPSAGAAAAAAASGQRGGGGLATPQTPEGSSGGGGGGHGGSGSMGRTRKRGRI
ncbi:hypothetical protein JCM10908_001073 [Rhodotorula pacifica]|uniref:uncharacterized protein n=1 Tax=Rhodotorula pacifica TaxID=1495444 RepID=UPI00317C7CB3